MSDNQNPFERLQWSPTSAADRTPSEPAPAPSGAGLPGAMSGFSVAPTAGGVTVSAAQDLSMISVPVQWHTTGQAVPAEASAPSRMSDEMDWSLVNVLKRDSVQLEEERGQTEVSAPARRAQAMEFIHQVVARQSQADLRNGFEWSAADEQRYVQAIYDARFGLGRIQPLLKIDDAEDIVIVGTGEVLVTHADGHQTRHLPVAESDADLDEQIAHIAENATPKRAFDAQHTDVTIMHEGRFRIHAISGEIALHPSVVIRQHLLRKITLADLSARNLMPYEVAQFLDEAVQSNLSIAVAGEQGTGKTTLLRALIHAIPTHERFATLETDQELFAHDLPGRENNLTLFARDGMGERNPDGSWSGAITVAQMVPPALRQGLTRLILGELRLGAESTAMFEAMQAGAGTMCSVHSPSPEMVPSRLADMVSQSGTYSIESAMRQIGLSIKLIVYIRRRDTAAGRRRFIEAITFSKLGDDGYTPAPEIIYRAHPWTGETLQFTPGPLAHELAMFERTLDRFEGDPS